jgi:hypothetical protein
MKASFISPPAMIPYPSNPKWMQFNDDWVFYIDKIPYWVPKGYWYDGASIPAPLWLLIGTPTSPIFWAPAGGHDPLYLTHARSKGIADEVLFQFCLQMKIPLWKARAIWAGVAAGAHLAWMNSKRDKMELDAVRKMIYARPDSEKFDTLWKAAA